MANDRLGMGKDGREDAVEMSGEIDPRERGRSASIAVQEVGRGRVRGIVG